MKTENLSKCIGCDESVTPPDCLVGVGTLPEELRERAVSIRADGIGAYVVCTSCHRHGCDDTEKGKPTGTRKRVLKLHFYEFGQLNHALRIAGGTSIGG